MKNPTTEIATIKIEKLMALMAATVKIDIIKRLVEANDEGNNYDSVRLNDLCSVLEIERKPNETKKTGDCE